MAIKKLANGRWEASYRDPLGKERVKRRRRRAEADRWLASVKADLQRGDYVEPRLARTLFSAWADLWKSTTVHLKLKTQSDYESALRNHVLPAFANRSVASIQQVDVLRFIADMTDASAGPGAVGAVRKVLRLVLNTAVGSGAIRANPCDGVRVAHSPKEAMLFLTAEDVKHLASTITPPYGTLVRFAAYTGMRAGGDRRAPRRTLRPAQGSGAHRGVGERGPGPRPRVRRAEDVPAPLGPAPPIDPRRDRRAARRR